MNGDSVTELIIGVIEGSTSIKNGVKSVSGMVVLGSPVITRGEASVPFTITGESGLGLVIVNRGTDTSLIDRACVVTRACIVTGASIGMYIVIGAMFGPSVRPGEGV